MGTWAGWEASFLSAASLPDTTENRNFLDDWASNANSPHCTNNPNDLTHHEPNSTNCHATGQAGVNIQRYTSHTWARTAFNSEIHSGKYPALLAAFQSGDPYTVSKPGPVGSDLAKWSSTKFATAYLNETQGTGLNTGTVTQAEDGYRALQRSVNKRLPVSLHTSKRALDAALRELHRAHKVRG